MQQPNHLVFVQTNDPAGNGIRVYDRADDGTLNLAATVSAGGMGGVLEPPGRPDPLASQGSLLYDAAHQLLFAVNAGSNTIAVLGFDDGHLKRRKVVDSGGMFPVSLTVHADLLYVLNALGPGSISGFRIGSDDVRPITGSTRSLNLDPATGPGQFVDTPGQIGFTPDGRRLVVTTKANRALIDVFEVRDDGTPSDAFVANSANTPIPFGFTFDQHGHLLVTDAGVGSVATYLVHGDGTTSQIASQTFGQQATCWVAGVGGGFYAANVGSDTLTGYRVSPTGTISPFFQVCTDSAPIDLTGTSDQGFVYAQTGGAGTVVAFQVNPDGSLNRVASLNGLNGQEGIAAT